MKNIGYYNGNIDLIENITIPMNDRVVYFGDGVYDAAYVNNHKPFALDDHLNRFYNSCKLLQIDFKMPRKELDSLLRGLITKIDDSEGILYWQASRGTAPRSHEFPAADVQPNLLAYVKPKKAPNPDKKLKLLSVEDERYFYCYIKTLNLIPNVLANQKAVSAGCDEAVFHRGERVTECSHSNISILKNGVLKTAPLDKLILPGTVRKHLIQICNELNVPVAEEPFKLDDVFEADEIIVSSATALLRSAHELDGKAVGGKNPKLLKLIQTTYLNKIKNETGKEVQFND